MKRKDPFKINRVLDVIRSLIHRASGIAQCRRQREGYGLLPSIESDINSLTKLKIQVVWRFKKE